MRMEKPSNSSSLRWLQHRPEDDPWLALRREVRVAKVLAVLSFITTTILFVAVFGGMLPNFP